MSHRAHGASVRRRGLIAAWALVLIAGLAITGCTHQKQIDPLADLDPIYVEVDPSGELPATYYDAFILLQQGNRAYNEQRFAQAEQLYGRLIETFPESEFAGLATYNFGLCLERQQRYSEALDYYLRAGQLWPDDFEPHEVPLRRGSCLEQLDRWSEAHAVYGEAAMLPGLAPQQQLKLEARAAIALYFAGQPSQAKQELRQVLEHYDELSRRIPLGRPTFIAQAYFVLGEVYYDQFSALNLNVPMEQMESTLEDKARLLLLARAQYLKAIRTHNPQWMTASMYKIGLGYFELREEILEAPLPDELDQEQQQAYRDQLLEAVEPLRSKSLAVLKKNLNVARQLDIDNEWVRLTRQIYEQISEDQ
ncbi:MAG: tetratricopeptide repeat protein [Candidatus Alcyoniella australis]|nr:tetratricopeptide repeat protein [Candidatus Alcyoniella australis]